MASISAAYFLAGTPRPKPHSVIFSLKPFKPSQLHYFSTKIRPHSSLNLSQPTRFRCLRASFVRACSHDVSDHATSMSPPSSPDAIPPSNPRVSLRRRRPGGLKILDVKERIKGSAHDKNGQNYTLNVHIRHVCGIGFLLALLLLCSGQVWTFLNVWTSLRQSTSFVTKWARLGYGLARHFAASFVREAIRLGYGLLVVHIRLLLPIAKAAHSVWAWISRFMLSKPKLN